MPLYEYACPSCHSEFELLIRGSESPRCPECGSEQVEKLLSVPATPAQSAALPIASRHEAGGCGLPQCGGGRCAMGGM